MKFFASTLSLALVVSGSWAQAAVLGRGRVVVTPPARVPTFLVTSPDVLKTFVSGLGVSPSAQKLLLKNGASLLGGGESLVAVPVAGQVFLMQLALGSPSVVGSLEGVVVPLGKAEKVRTEYHSHVYDRLLETVRRTEGKTAANGIAERIEVLRGMFDGPKFFTSSGGGMRYFIGGDDAQQAVLVRQRSGELESAGTVLSHRLPNSRLGVWALSADDQQFIRMKMPSGYSGYHFIRRTLDGGLLIELESRGAKKLALVDPALRQLTVFSRDVSGLKLQFAKVSSDGLHLTWLENDVVTRYDVRTGKRRKAELKKVLASLEKTLPGLRLTDVDSQARLGLVEADGGILAVVDMESGRVLASRKIVLMIDTGRDEGDNAAFSEDGGRVIIDRIDGPNQEWDYRADTLRDLGK